MAKNKTTKIFHLTSEQARTIAEISDELEMTESAFIGELVRNYAIDIGKLDGIKNYALEEAMTVPTYVKKSNNSNASDEIVNIRKELRIIKSILNNLDERSYVEYDLNNLLFHYLKPENELGAFKSTDTKLTITNSTNLHDYVKESLKNYDERIKRSQIDNSN